MSDRFTPAIEPLAIQTLAIEMPSDATRLQRRDDAPSDRIMPAFATMVIWIGSPD